MTTHASIIPLIGGETIGTMQAFDNAPPSYILSYEPFKNNDSHIVNYLNNIRGHDVPYHFVESGTPSFSTKVDSLSSVCPCAGLSQLNVNASADQGANDWMYKSTEYALGTIGPRVYWGENAPTLMSAMGDKVRANLVKIAAEHGYTASFYKTRSLLHGLPQVRNRSFFFFWKGDKAPVFNYFDRPYESIEKFIAGVQGNSQTEPINPKTPSKDDPYYRYILEVIAGGKTHREYMETMYEGMPVRNNDVMCIIEDQGHDYLQVEKWFRANGYVKEADRCLAMDAKLKAGGQLMRRGTVLPKNYIGAFVGHYPTMLAHPTEDRYISYREAMAIMGLPQDFELLNPKRSYNHICQNVPVITAKDMASEVRVCLEEPEKREWISGSVYSYNPAKKFEVRNMVQKTTSLSSFFDGAVDTEKAVA